MAALVVEHIGVEQHLQLGLQALDDGALNRVGHPGAHIAAYGPVHGGRGQVPKRFATRQPGVGTQVFKGDAVVTEPGRNQRQQLARFILAQRRAGRVGLVHLIGRDMPVAGRDEGAGLRGIGCGHGGPGNQARGVGQLHGAGQHPLMWRREIHLVALHHGGGRQAGQQGLQMWQLQTFPDLGNVGGAAGVGNNDFSSICGQGLGSREQGRGQGHGRYCRVCRLCRCRAGCLAVFAMLWIGELLAFDGALIFN